MALKMLSALFVLINSFKNYLYSENLRITIGIIRVSDQKPMIFNPSKIVCMCVCMCVYELMSSAIMSSADPTQKMSEQHLHRREW